MSEYDFSQFESRPDTMRRPDGSRRFAFTTFLIMNDSYLASALMMAYGLRQQASDADIVCLVTDDISPEARAALAHLYDHVVEIPEFFVKHKSRKGREDRPLWFTRLHSLRLGADGDLGLAYDKICILDADVYPIRHADHLFTLNAPAGILNEQKHYCLQTDESGRFDLPASVLSSGRWNWHERYEPECAHGRPIPKHITDRPREDVSNLGLNGSLYLVEPSLREFERIAHDVTTPEIQRYVGELFKWPDMQYLTMTWSGRWTSVDIKYSSFNGYPNMDAICSCHHSGFKPWYFKKKSLAVYKEHEDFQHWFDCFLRMATVDHPALLENRLIANTVRRTRALLAGESNLR